MPEIGDCANWITNTRHCRAYSVSFQFIDAHGGRSELANDDSRRAIGQAGGFAGVAAPAASARASAPITVSPAPVTSETSRASAGSAISRFRRQQPHPVLAAGDQDALAAGAVAEAACGGARLVVGPDAHERDRLRLVMIGRDHALRRRSSRYAGPSDRSGPGFLRAGRHRRRPWRRLVNWFPSGNRTRGSRRAVAARSSILPDEGALERARHFRVGLVIDARDLLVARRHDAQLASRAAARVGDEAARACAGPRQFGGQPGAVRVGPDEADRVGPSAQGDHVVGDICRARPS